MNKVTLVVAMIIVIFLVMTTQQENFETIAEKEKVHKDYFAGNPSTTYEDYRVAVSGGNVVDYMKYKK